MSHTSSHLSLHPAFQQALDADREVLNQRFRAAAIRNRVLDGHAFNHHLAVRVNPIIAAIAQTYPERVRIAVQELFEVSLDLCQSGYWISNNTGPESKLSELDRLWIDVLPRLATLVAREPRRTVGSLSNAVIQIAQHSSQAAQRWLTRIGIVASEASSVQELQDVGCTLAWQAGLINWRPAALLCLRRLPSKLLASTLQLAPQHASASAETLIDLISKDRWFNPQVPHRDQSQNAYLAFRVGAFIGFGGPFGQPPKVLLHEGDLIVSDGDASWTIHCDVFGAGLLSRHDPIPTQSRRSASPGTAALASSGKLTWGSQAVVFPELRSCSSQACDGETLAVTLPTSFHIFLIALPSKPPR